MALYARIIGRDDEGRVVPHRINPEVITTVMAEFARDAINAALARDICEAMGMTFSDSEEEELIDLLQTISSKPSPEAKLARYLEVRDVLFLARLMAPGYSRPVNVKARLGV
jgi:hypothetical protein